MDRQRLWLFIDTFYIDFKVTEHQRLEVTLFQTWRKPQRATHSCSGWECAGTAPLSTFEKLSWFASPRAFHLNLGSSADTFLSGRPNLAPASKVWDTNKDNCASFSYTYLF